MTYSYLFTQDLQWQTQTTWQKADTPFMSFKYWQALIDSGAVGEHSGWTPVFIVVYKSSQLLKKSPVCVMPVFIKTHHQGEYVFDQMWAEAYARYGANYYPRLVSCVPYTPVAGDRLWLAESIDLHDSPQHDVDKNDVDKNKAKQEGLAPVPKYTTEPKAVPKQILQTLMQAIDDIAKQVNASSWHGLFVNKEFANNASQLSPPLLERQGCQFIWQNYKTADGGRAYKNFDNFLSTLTAKKRKNIRAERRKVAKQGIKCILKTGLEIGKKDWDVFYQCYAITYAIRGQKPYLSPEFFTKLSSTMSNSIMLAQALDKSDNIVASSLFFYDSTNQAGATLYGRYWGALDEYDCLHFELCYYQGIEFAIKQGLTYFDPGTQGEHKLIRGFIPNKTYSLHKIYDERFLPAIRHFCEDDVAYMKLYRQQAYEALPFNADNKPKFNG